ncbi:MAG: hypothetical protein ABEI54_01895 [Candidatus Bipolaricaulia bacterium]
MAQGQESGIRSDRVEFVRESTVGVVPDDPSWNKFSDVVKTLDWTPDAQIEAQRGLGSADPYGHNSANESHEVTVGYDLQQQIASGKDPLYDGMARTSGDLLPNTHSIVERNVRPKSDVSGADATRTYTVVKGAYIGTATLSGEAGSAQPLNGELSYTAEKVRSYQVHQPGTAETLAVKSTDSSDTTQSLIIESEGASTSDTVDLNGTTEATTIVTFDDIDALELSAETLGDVHVSIQNGATLATIFGKNTYGGREGDLGIPALGGGSHPTDIGSSYEFYQATSSERPSGTDPAYRVSAVELSVDNSVDTTGRSDSVRQEISVGPRTISLTATVMGPNETHDQIMDHLKATKNDYIWTLSNTTLTVGKATLVDSGNRERGPEQSFYEFDSGFEGESLSFS